MFLVGGGLWGEAGSWETYKANLSYGRALTNGIEFAITGSYYESAGQESLYYPEYDDPSTQNGVTRRTDHDRYHLVHGRISYGGFTLQGGFNEREKHVPTGSWGTDYGDPRTLDMDSRAYLDLGFQRSFEADWDLSARLYYDKYDYDGDYVTAGVMNKDFAYGSRWGSQWQVGKTYLERHRVLAGLEYRDNFQQDQENYDDHPYALYVRDRRESYDLGVYAQVEVGILTNLTLSAGGRWDYHSLFGDSVNPRLGLIYTPIQGSTFKALYGTAYRAPTVYEAYYSGVGYEANSELRPETIATYELVYEQDLGHHVKLVSTGYYYELDDLISQETDPKDPADPDDDLLVYRNLESARAVGGELGLEGHWTNGFRGRLSYALQRTEDALTHREVSNSPRHLAKLQLTVPLYRDKILAGFELLYASPVLTLRGESTKDQYLANVTLFSRKLVKGVELSVGVYNVFDTRIEHPGAREHLQDVIEQDGRSFRVKLTYQF
jgi:iron complex outermembrane receptor protein